MVLCPNDADWSLGGALKILGTISLSVALAGCPPPVAQRDGGASTGAAGGGSSSGGVTGTGFQAFFGELAQVECALQTRCAEPLGAPLPAYAQALCPANEATALASQYAGVLSEVDAGLTVFSPASAQQCFAALLDAGCGSSTASLPACGQMFQGTVPDGGACYSDVDCASGWCTASSASGTCPGSCLPYEQQGQECNTAPCDPSLTCDTAIGCQPAAFVGAGATCGSSDGGIYQCTAGFWCNQTGPTGTCVAEIPEGSACGGDATPCAGNLICLGAPPGSQGVCTPPSDVAGSCIPAGVDSQGDPYGQIGCLAYLACVPQGDGGTCQIPPGSGVCGSGGLTTGACAYPDVCSAEGTCQPPLPNGALCDLDRPFSCASGYCSTRSETCAASLCQIGRP